MKRKANNISINTTSYYKHFLLSVIILFSFTTLGCGNSGSNIYENTDGTIDSSIENSINTTDDSDDSDDSNDSNDSKSETSIITNNDTNNSNVGSNNGVNPSYTGSVSLDWDAPSINADGSYLNDLSGYKIYSAKNSSDYTNPVDIGVVTSIEINDLSPGTWCFTITAYDNANNESDYSVEACTTI